MEQFNSWFSHTTGYASGPRPWQIILSSDDIPKSRLIRIPTGQGKTLGVLAAWAWHRCVKHEESWPCRLVWCLPMRVLTEQTCAEAKAFLKSAGLDHVSVHQIMGGVDADDWHLYPEKEAVIIGTQDMLLSRALNRGYASGRARWPMEFGLLSQDALWVYDEIQLMDVGLATAAQLQAYRDDDTDKHLRPVYSWWMSATLQADWLSSVDTSKHHSRWCESPVSITEAEHAGGPCAITKTLATEEINPKDATAFAQRILEEHRDGEITLVVCNTVDRACETYESLIKQGRGEDSLKLVHSRFRPVDRTSWREEFLCREQCQPGTDRIIVATQVVEAGVDISAHLLVTELAPWPSLVQRFGRCARYDGPGRVLVVSRGHAEDKTALPYTSDELTVIWKKLTQLDGVGISALERFESELDASLRKQLYPYHPAHLLLRNELDELFDTTPDLTGADLDISRFIRTGEERDCYICWYSWTEKEAPDQDFRPMRNTLCSVPVYRVIKWLEKHREVLRPYTFDYVDGYWQRLKTERIRPGMTIIVDAAGGGYDPHRGFTGKKDGPVPIIAPVAPNVDGMADGAQDCEDLSKHQSYQHIAAHNMEVAHAVAFIAEIIAPAQRGLLHLAGRLHDWGKAHPAFRNCIKAEDAPNRPDLAKAPEGAWHRGRNLYSMGEGNPSRLGFRHELASVLAIFELLARHSQQHPALLGELSEVIACGALTIEEPGEQSDAPLAQELASLSRSDFDLLCYLIASHHGKLRASWHGCPQDQDYPIPKKDTAGLPLRGVREGDEIPSIPLCATDGEEAEVPGIILHLTPANLGLNGRYGISWRERSLALQEQYGPAALAYLEALLRAADIRISRGDKDLTGGQS